MHENIKRYLGCQWLERELYKIQNDDWIDDKVLHKEIVRLTGFDVIDLIDKLLGKLSGLNGFDRWCQEAKKEKERYDILFELFCFDNLSGSIELKIPTSTGDVDAFLKTQNHEIYVDIHNLNKIPESIESKVHDLFKKAKRKFTDKEGVLFIGCEKLIEGYSNMEPIFIPSFDAFKNEICRILEDPKRINKNILGFILVIAVFVVNPITHEAGFRKYFYILNKPWRKGGPDIKFLVSALKVDEIFIQESLLAK